MFLSCLELPVFQLLLDQVACPYASLTTVSVFCSKLRINTIFMLHSSQLESNNSYPDPKEDNILIAFCPEFWKLVGCEKLDRPAHYILTSLEPFQFV